MPLKRSGLLAGNAAGILLWIAPGFAGLYQIDIQVPGGVTGDGVPLAVSMPGSATDTRTIAIRAK